MLGALAFLLGVSVGSFVNVVADRLPGGRSLVRPRSFCESCNRTLTSLDLVPIASYLWLRGRCRHCGARIPLRSPLVELFTGALFTLTYLRFGYSAETVVVCAALSVLLIVTLIDLEHGLILNVIVFPTMAALVVVAPFWSELGFARPLLGSLGMPASLFNSLIAGAGLRWAPQPPRVASTLFSACAIRRACSSVMFMLKSNLTLRPSMDSV